MHLALAVHTENSVRINQHTCGTLIADLVDALSLLASTSQSKDWKSLPRPVVECIKVLGVRVANVRRNFWPSAKAARFLPVPGESSCRECNG